MNPNLQLIIEKLSDQLCTRKWKLATAESCTGGGVAFYLTQKPGSSHWFERGFVTYSNLSKKELLKVKQETLVNEGAVSKKTVEEMAIGALKNSKAEVSLAITGIAGPDGGSLDKPVGMVWFGFACVTRNTVSLVKLFEGDRQSIREHAIQFALENLLKFIE